MRYFRITRQKPFSLFEVGFSADCNNIAKNVDGIIYVGAENEIQPEAGATIVEITQEEFGQWP